MKIDVFSFLVGFLVAGVAGFIFGRIARWNFERRATKYPMVVFTRETPADVIRRSRRASMRLVLWLFILGIYAALVLLMLFVWTR
ncbi:MAG TPA: hypothetical protein G4O02_09245 [Caldilineae bacterium]|jgi:hypothetical protein|nr:hypothetical protein [Caldilineae bacterium]